MVITSISKFATFDADTANTLGRAFDEAWRSLQEAGVEDRRTATEIDLMREGVALRIIQYAQEGERDVKRLKEDALAYLANSSERKRA